MPSTEPYAPFHNFAHDPAPQNKVNAEALQAELNAVANRFATLIRDLGVSIRDDNTLTDELVRIRNLHPELRTYLDSRLVGNVLTQNVTYLLPVKACSTVNIVALNSPLTPPVIDGITCYDGDRVLLKNQTNKSTNGVWIIRVGGVSGGLWERAADLDDGDPISSNIGVIVQQSTSGQELSVWQLKPAPTTTNPDVYPTDPVVGTDPNDWFQIYGPFPLPVNKGGTGASTPSGARANLGCAGFAASTITGDGTTVLFTVNHALNTQDVAVTVRRAGPPTSTGADEGVTTYAISPTQVQVGFTTPPLAGETLRVIIIGG